MGSYRESIYTDTGIFLIKYSYFEEQITNEDNNNDNTSNEGNNNDNTSNEDDKENNKYMLILILIGSIILLLFIAMITSRRFKEREKKISQIEKITTKNIAEPDWETLIIRLESCYEKVTKANKIPGLSLIKNCLKINYDFTEKMYGYEKFKIFLEKLLYVYPKFEITELSKNEYILSKIEDQNSKN